MNLLNNTATAVDPAAAGPIQPSDPLVQSEPEAVVADGAARPDYVPEKFWDGDAGEIRADAMAKSYGELERMMGGAGGDVVPQEVAGYTINAPHEMLAGDDNVNSVLHEAGFTQAQAQLVYDLAAEFLLPVVGTVATEFELDRQKHQLHEQFGGEERWAETSRQLSTWGQANLNQEVYEAMSSSPEGVVALHRMMQNNEPGLSGVGGAISAESEDQVKQLMRDPRYWRDRDPAVVNRVRAGFERIAAQGGQ